MDSNKWEIIYNQKQPHNLWESEQLITSNNIILEDKENATNVIKYHYSFDFPHHLYPDGEYKATMYHILDMVDYVGERKVEKEV